MKHKLLLIEDDESFFDAVQSMLADHSNIELVWQETGAKGIQAFQAEPTKFSVAIIDYKLPDMTGVEVCGRLRKIKPDVEVLFASGHEEHVVEMAEVGPDGFLFKGRRSVQEMKDKILRNVARFEGLHRVIGEDQYEPSKAEIDLRSIGIIGRSEVTYKLFLNIQAAKTSQYPTLIIGETGTGKELVAKALTPKGMNLVAVNCASFIQRENFIESDFFGYVKGAFTGANHDTPGILHQAHNNVLFLDELQTLPISGQAKLLRLLQEMTFRRVGDNVAKETSIKFKLVASVQPDIGERIRDGRFMLDLVERISTLRIEVPPLRERLDDIEPLVRFFQDEFNLGKNPAEKRQVGIAVINEMAKREWPTNVRGLQNSVKRMLTLCKSMTATPKDFLRSLEVRVMEANQLAENPIEESLADATERFEVRAIIEALKRSKNQLEAAARLRMVPSSLCRKLLKLGINPSEYLLS